MGNLSHSCTHGGDVIRIRKYLGMELGVGTVSVSLLESVIFRLVFKEGNRNGKCYLQGLIMISGDSG